MGIKISQLPLGTAAFDSVVPATNPDNTLTEKITLRDIANLRKDWEIAQFSANSFSATAGHKYVYPPTNALVSEGFDVLDPSSPSNGDWYFLWNQSPQVIRVGGTPIPNNQIVARYYSAETSSWTTQTAAVDLSMFAPVATSGSASDLGTGTLPDQRLSSNIARTADIASAVSSLINSAPDSLNTLQQLADALGSDPNFATTIMNQLADKAPINNPTFTGTVNGITKAMVGLGNVPNVDATARSNHTGTQLANTISDFSDAVGNALLGSITNDVVSAISTTMTAGSNVTISYNGTSDTLTIALSSSLAGVTIDGGSP